jgi:hypothetical protein
MKKKPKKQKTNEDELKLRAFVLGRGGIRQGSVLFNILMNDDKEKEKKENE